MELALDGNPLQSLSNYSAWVLHTCSRLIHLDLKKVTPDMKEVAVKPQVVAEEPRLPSESLITAIAQEWNCEVERIKARGLNFFRRKKKETHEECMVQSGHAEIEGDSNLFIYGNALEVIVKTEFQDTVNSIYCQYLRFDHIVQNSAIAKLRKFQKLKKFIFIENNLHSYIQLSKLESLVGLNSINIEKNDILFTVMYRSFIVYRFPNVSEINGKKVDETDKAKAKQQFQSFDKILCMPSILVRDI